ncbi:hypothetical protein D3C71_2026530 [compost metagenome]
MVTIPYFQWFETWKDIKTFERAQKGDIKIKNRFYGTRPGFKFISSKVFSRYNTEQMDKTSAKLPYLSIKPHDDSNSLIDTSI